MRKTSCVFRGRRFFVLVSSNNSFEMSRRRKVRSSKISEHGRALFQTAYCQAEKTKIKNFRYRADSNKLKNNKKKMSDDVEVVQDVQGYFYDKIFFIAL